MDGNNRYPMALPLGSVLAGQYVIEGVLGQGGFGITYAARDHVSKNVVAIKEYFPDSIATRVNQSTVVPYSGNKEDNYQYGLDCFKKEAYTLGQFAGHPHIVNIHCYFEENGTAYFVMDMIRGMSLASYLKQKKTLKYEEALAILLPVMQALVDVHAKNIIHRDISPDNIYLEDGGGIKLLDFGAARYSIGDRTQSLSIILKHGFAPPEQYTSRGHQGPYTDIYALGATFYYVLSGRKLPDSIERLTEDKLIPLSARGVSLPPAADLAIMRALSVDRNNRFQKMPEFIKALNVGAEASRPPIASAFVQPAQMQGAQPGVQKITTVSAGSAHAVAPYGRTNNSRFFGAVFITVGFAALLLWLLYMYIRFGNTGHLYSFLTVTVLYIILMTALAVGGSAKSSYKKGFKLLRAWQFEKAEKCFYPIMFKTGFNALDIYEMMYREALNAERKDLAERYLSEVRMNYGNEAAEIIRNNR